MTSPPRSSRLVAFGQSSTGNPAGASTLRRSFHLWLDTQLMLSAEQLSDLTLAVNEALANAVEHAYAGADTRGDVELHARFDVRTGDLVVVIRDHGTWRPHQPDPHHLRGRGIPLIQALAPDSTIDTDDSGTWVQLRWSGLTQRHQHTDRDTTPAQPR
ncbi:ATP-binding protein [Aldersonia kunmingensis]|uniref:ATP-binding protein n=1 Tax=Aldersonia kunmingensis TaxID=408066 RepID=UPI001470BC2B|nr:ATP-binding protein [Aldersonia kunmingensis]